MQVVDIIKQHIGYIGPIGIMEIIREMLPNRHKMRIIIRRMHISRHRIIRFNKESIGAAFGRAPQGRGAPLWMLSLFNVVVLCLRMHTLRAIIRVLCTLGVICVLFHHSHIFPKWVKIKTNGIHMA